MGIKKIARPINKAKNEFVKWLKNNNAEDIDVYNEDENKWDYYCCVSGFVNDKLYTVYFSIWKGDECIDYSYGGNRYNGLSIQEFLDMLGLNCS